MVDTFRNSSKEQIAAAEKLQMFDAFLGKITEKLKKASPGLPILPPKLYKTYLEMDLAERELIDLLALQITYNSSEV